MTINDYETGAGSTPAPGRRIDDIMGAWLDGTFQQRSAVMVAFPALGEAIDRGDAAETVRLWRTGHPFRVDVRQAWRDLAGALDRATLDAGTTPAPGRPGEFRGLSDVVKVWRAATLPGQTAVGLNFPALAQILDRADEYMREVEQQETVNEATPASADDREPAHTIEVLDDMLRVATGQYQQSPSASVTPRNWLDMAAYFAADAITEKTTLTAAKGTAAITARNNCAAATGLADMFAHLAEAACAVEGARRGR